MSWSPSGSGALVQITALMLNDELHSWLFEIITPAQNAMAA